MPWISINISLVLLTKRTSKYSIEQVLVGHRHQHSQQDRELDGLGHKFNLIPGFETLPSLLRSYRRIRGCL